MSYLCRHHDICDNPDMIDAHSCCGACEREYVTCAGCHYDCQVETVDDGRCIDCRDEQPWQLGKKARLLNSHPEEN